MPVTKSNGISKIDDSFEIVDKIHTLAGKKLNQLKIDVIQYQNGRLEVSYDDSDLTTKQKADINSYLTSLGIV